MRSSRAPEAASSRCPAASVSRSRISENRSGRRLKLTKGDLFRHYVRVAPLILPVLADRPLVMKRYPNGIAASPFYQHRAPDKVPPGVRIEKVTTGTETRPHLVGGSLITLLYTAQLASISQDPWFSRVGSATMIDHVAIDLDPPDDLPYARVLDVARWVRDELATLKAPGFAKTSGAGGLHVYVPMPPVDAVCGGIALRANRRDDGREQAPEAGDDRTIAEGARPTDLRRLHAERARQDARQRLQRARQRLRRRLDAAHVG